MGNSKSQYPESASDYKRQKASRNGGVYPHSSLERSQSVPSHFSRASGSYPHHIGNDSQYPIHFHNVHGMNVVVSEKKKVASRVNSFCYAIAFTSRPIGVEEKICLKLKKVETGWSGVMRFGFTSNDPASIDPSGLPRYVCPDLTNEPGYWAKALPEKFAKQDNILSFYVNTQGCVFYAINDKLEGMFFNGVDVTRPLWVIIDIYGNTTSLEIIDKNANSQRSISLSEEDGITSSMPASGMISLPPDMEEAVAHHFQVTDHINPIRFSLTMGNALRCRNRKLVSLKTRLGSSLAFTSSALDAGQTAYFYCADGGRSSPHHSILRSTEFGIGITNCDPSTILISDLPFDSGMLMDRPEYWIMFQEFQPPHAKQYFALTVERGGWLSYRRQGQTEKETLFHMDVSQPLHIVFDLCPKVSAIASIGSSTEPEYLDIPPYSNDIESTSQLLETPDIHTSLHGEDRFSSINLIDDFQIINDHIGTPPSMPEVSAGIQARQQTNASTSASVTDSARPRIILDHQPSSSRIEAWESANGDENTEPGPSQTASSEAVHQTNEAEPGEFILPGNDAVASGGISVGEFAGLSAPIVLGALSWFRRSMRNRLSQNNEEQGAIEYISDSSEHESSSSSEDGINHEDFFNAREGSQESSSSSSSGSFDDVLQRNARLLQMLNGDLLDLLPQAESTPNVTESDLGASGGNPTKPIQKMEAETAEDDNTVEGKECVVCYDSSVNAVIYSCGHACMCYECGKVLLRQRRPACPICRARVKDIIRMYHS